MMLWILFACFSNDCQKSDWLGDGEDLNCDGVDGVDLDQDGIASWQSGGLDCDDADAEKGEGAWLFFDFDLDGYGDASITEFHCAEVFGWSAKSGDCDDSEAEVHPTHIEICDFLDNDCNGLVDSEDEIFNEQEILHLFPDLDGDGYGSEVHEPVCFGTEGYVLNDRDCDDGSDAVAPNQEDIAGDGVDQNCDGEDKTSQGCQLDNCTFSLKNGDFSQDFAYIPTFTFQMGSPQTEVGRDGDEEQHWAHLSYDFYLMNTEVNQGFYQELIGSNPSWLQHPDHPVETVSWLNAAFFANALTEWSNQTLGTAFQSCYLCQNGFCDTAIDPIQECTGYRLPTEAEWELAARAGTRKAIWTERGGGDILKGWENASGCEETWSLSDGTPIDDLAWFCLNADGHSPVAQKQPNGFGLYDMNGNVWEWVQDDYAPYSGEVTDPVSTVNPDAKVVRGGRWAFWARAIRSSERGTYSPDNQRNELGFRIARSAIE